MWRMRQDGGISPPAPFIQNHQVIEFYEHIGYQKANEINDHGLNLVIMRKELKNRKA
jgi:hypothetical protein